MVYRAPGKDELCRKYLYVRQAFIEEVGNGIIEFDSWLLVESMMLIGVMNHSFHDILSGGSPPLLNATPVAVFAYSRDERRSRSRPSRVIFRKWRASNVFNIRAYAPGRLDSRYSRFPTAGNTFQGYHPAITGWRSFPYGDGTAGCPLRGSWHSNRRRR